MALPRRFLSIAIKPSEVWAGSSRSLDPLRSSEPPSSSGGLSTAYLTLFSGKARTPVREAF